MGAPALYGGGRAPALEPGGGGGSRGDRATWPEAGLRAGNVLTAAGACGDYAFAVNVRRAFTRRMPRKANALE